MPTLKKPKNSERYYWTQHVYQKMLQYNISEQMIRRVIRNPKRIEEGIAPDTIAVMQPRGTKKKQEIWVMYQLNTKSQNQESTKPKVGKIKIITAWRYPGTSPKRAKIPIPIEIIEELNISI